MCVHNSSLPVNQTDRITPAALAEQTDTITAQLCDQMQSDGMTPALARRVAAWAKAGGGYDRQEIINRAAYAVRLIIDRISTARHPRTQAEVFRIAFGFHRDACDSVRATARRVHLSHPSLLKQAAAIRAELHLPKHSAFTGSGRSGAPRIPTRIPTMPDKLGRPVIFRVGSSNTMGYGAKGSRVLPKTSVCR